MLRRVFLLLTSLLLYTTSPFTGNSRQINIITAESI
jgi:hypothetical protein